MTRGGDNVSTRSRHASLTCQDPLHYRETATDPDNVIQEVFVDQET
jgi:hypothetical protein